MGLVFRVDSVALFVAMGWGGAAQTFVGQNLGGGKYDRAKRAGVLAATYDALMNVAFVVVLAFYAERVLRFFGKDDAPVAIGLDYLKIVGKSYVGLGIGIVLGNAMAGAKAAKTAFRVDVAVLLAFQLPLCLGAVLLFHASLLSLFACVAATGFAGALAYGVVYARGKWIEAGKAS
jgi:Na+-driven multidrug efflux pump